MINVLIVSEEKEEGCVILRKEKDDL